MTEWLEDCQQRISFHELLAGEPDNCIIEGAFAEPDGDDAHITYRDTRAGMLDLISVAAITRGWDMDWTEVFRQADHEVEHATAAYTVGMTIVRYGFALWDEGPTSRWQFSITHAAPDRPVTKLAYASIVAAPSRLSLGDERALTEMGYTGVSDVSDRIGAFNATAERRLPVPASARRAAEIRAGQHQPEGDQPEGDQP